MNQEKYQKVKVIVDNVTEENADTKFKMIILLIKNSFFEGNTSSPEELWFEKDLFKRDTDYYLAIISTINVFIKYCSKEKDFQIPSFENEIDHIYSTKKLSKAYVNLNNISKLLELDEGFYTKIYCAILSLGIKKESQINKILVESLREFAEDDRIKKSIYYQKIGEMDPCKTDMDELSLTNIIVLFNLIMSNADDEKIIEVLKAFENSDDFKEQRSSISTNLENNEYEEKKSGNGNNIIPKGPENESLSNIPKNKENTELNKNANSSNFVGNENKSGQTMKNVCENVKKTFINGEKEKTSIPQDIGNENCGNSINKNPENSSSIDEEKIDRDKEIQTNNFEIIEKKQENVNEIHENSTVIKTQEKEKVDLSPENHSSLQEEKNDIMNTSNINDLTDKINGKENNNISSSLIHSNTTIHQKKFILDKDSADNLDKKINYFDFPIEGIYKKFKIELEISNENMKEQKDEGNKNIEEDEKEKEDKKQEEDEKLKKVKDKEEDNKKYIMNIVMPFFQRFNRYRDIKSQMEKLEGIIKEFETLQSFQKEIYVDKIELEKDKIMLNGTKAVVEALKPATITNIKRKLLDIIIFSILKKNKNKFILDKNYCPNENFLNKVSDKLDAFKNKKGISDKEKNEIETKIKFISELIKQDKGIITFPFVCNDNDLNNILRYLNFCKGQFNQVVHVSKKALNFYLNLSEKNDKKFGDILNLYNYYEKEKGNNNEINKIHPVEGDAEEIVTDDLNNEKAFKIDKNFAFEFLLNNKFNSENISSEIEKKLDEINTRKKIYISKYADTVKNGCHKLLNHEKKNENKDDIDEELEIFTEKEKDLIMKELAKFKISLDSLEKQLLKIKDEKNEQLQDQLIEEFFLEFKKITDFELDFDLKHFRYLCETEYNRCLLPFFQFVIMLFTQINLASKTYFKILNEFYENNMKFIMSSLSELKKQTNELLVDIRKITKIKSAKTLFFEWKMSKFMYLGQKFNSFYKSIMKSIDGTTLILKDELIFDQVTLLWLIKNDLDKYFD